MMVQMKMILMFNKYRTMIIKVGELIFERFCQVRKPSDQHLKKRGFLPDRGDRAACIYFFAVSFGAKDITLHTVWSAVADYNPNITGQQIIHELRLPRVLGAAVTGAAFAAAGALMQGVTRNPLADSGVLGVNAGAMFVVALSFAFSLIYHTPC